ncbi:hypothetical protein EMIT0P100_320010 [Pseudomonas sp. IT-P100]
MGASSVGLRWALDIGVGGKRSDVQNGKEAGSDEFVPVHGDVLKVSMGSGVRQVVLSRWNPFNRPEVSAMCRSTGPFNA